MIGRPRRNRIDRNHNVDLARSSARQPQPSADKKLCSCPQEMLLDSTLATYGRCIVQCNIPFFSDTCRFDVLRRCWLTYKRRLAGAYSGVDIESVVSSTENFIQANQTSVITTQQCTIAEHLSPNWLKLQFRHRRVTLIPISWYINIRPRSDPWHERLYTNGCVNVCLRDMY